MPCILRLYGIEHSHICHMASFASQHIVQSRKEGVEAGQLGVVERIAPRQFGQEGDVAIVVPDGMGNQMVDALRVLLDGYLIERLDRDVAHSAVRFGHDEGLVPIVGR